MLLHQLTGRVAWDAAGSIAIGALMGVAGLVLINLNRRFLAGMPISPEQRWAAVRALAAMPEVERVTSLFAEFIGPSRLIVAARVVLAGEHSQAELGRLLRALEQRIKENPYVGQATLTLAAPDEPALEPPGSTPR
jgi:divalent metal cation (Fe/Co/Zn/Cd) transporter